MTVILKTIKDLETYDLSKSEKFLEHHNTPHSKTTAILEQFQNGFYSFLEDNEEVVLVDLGANIGLFSLYMSSICKEVYAVEPTPSHIEIMKDLLKKLKVKNIFPHQVAIHTKNGEEQFQLNSSNSTMNSFLRHGIDPGGTDSVMVPTTTLADFIKNTVKNDPSFEDAIKEIDAIYVEVHDFEGVGKMEENVNKVIERLESLGKKTMKLTYDGVLGYDG